MTRKPRVLLDVDGPLTTGFARRVCRELRRMGVDEARAEKITQWDIMKSFRVDGETARDAYGALRAAGVAATFEPREGALEFVERLRAADCDVFAVTAPLGGSPTWVYDRGVWLKDELGFDAKHVINADDKVPVDGDVIVDDKVETVEAWQAERPDKLAVLWRASYNATRQWRHAVWNYDELYAVIADWLWR